MNSQFVMNQNAFNDLIRVAKNVTTDQTVARENQIEQLTGVLTELMSRLQEKTQDSIGSMQKSLTAITGDISSKVLDLSAHMAVTVEEASEDRANVRRRCWTRPARSVHEAHNTWRGCSKCTPVNSMDRGSQEPARWYAQRIHRLD